jgi:hypothetical protein
MMPRRGLYIYGLIRARTLPPLGRIGLEDGGQPGLVEAASAGLVAAVVSRFATDRRPAPLRRNLQPHDRVVQETAKTTTILPITFGHVARGPRAVRELLRTHADDIVAELDRLEGMVEMSVRLRWDVANVFSYFLDSDPALAAERDSVFHPSRPATYAEKLELGRLFETRLRARKRHLESQLLHAFCGAAADVDTGATRGEKEIADLAFLVPRAHAARFAAGVSELAEQWPPEYLFQCTGPWAPSRFVHLDLRGEVSPDDDAGGAE